MHFSVLIPTYNRPADLLACLGSVAMQDVLPSQCVIVDDAALSESELGQIRRTLGSVELTYHRKDHEREPRGQSASKNIGFKLCKSEIVFILDDDVVLEQGFFSAIVEVWRTRDDGQLMGVGGAITNLRGRSGIERVYNALFLLTAPRSWDVTPVGFQVWDESITAGEIGYYVHGGLSSLRKSHALRFPFNTFRGGRTVLEDVDFCLRAKNAGYYFYTEPRARALHKASAASRESLFLSGVKESASRKEIFRSNIPTTPRNVVWFCWSSLGWVLRQFLAGNLHKGLGMVVGLLRR